MTEEPTPAPTLPQYPPPNTGLPLADPRQTKPLYKMMKMMLKPRVKMKAPKPPAKWKKKLNYY